MEVTITMKIRKTQVFSMPESTGLCHSPREVKTDRARLTFTVAKKIFKGQ
jgi:hypothetical protein